MSDSKLTTTTFHYDKEKYWVFKQVVALQQKTVKEVSSQLLDRVIEDYQDQQLRLAIESEIYNWELSGESPSIYLWVTMKRRMGLDGASSHSKH